MVRNFVRDLRRYGLASVVGDRYGAEGVADAFRRYRILDNPAALPKSDIYREALPLMNAAEVELLDHPRLRAQLLRLERRTALGGRESIDHPHRLHDDLANAALGALWLARLRVHSQIQTIRF